MNRASPDFLHLGYGCHHPTCHGGLPLKPGNFKVKRNKLTDFPQSSLLDLSSQSPTDDGLGMLLVAKPWLPASGLSRLGGHHLPAFSLLLTMPALASKPPAVLSPI